MYQIQILQNVSYFIGLYRYFIRHNSIVIIIRPIATVPCHRGFIAWLADVAKP